MCNKMTMRKYVDGDMNKLNPILYKKCDIDSNSPTKEYTNVILIRNEIIAFIDLNKVGDGIYTIDMFEVFKQGKGYGKKIIRCLQNNKYVNIIEINPITSSIPFWEKLGFKWSDDVTMMWQRQ